MRVLILEPDFTGHHGPYLRHMITGLRELGQEIVLVSSSGATRSREFELHLQDVAGDIQVDETFADDTSSSHRFAAARYAAITQAIERHRPEQIYVTYADLLTEYLSFRSMIGANRLWPAGIEGEGLYFRCRFAYPVEDWTKSITRALSWQLVHRTNWQRLHLLDPLGLDILHRKSPQNASRFRLMPDPVEAVKQVETLDAREQLGLPQDGRIIGCIGVLSERKGVDLLLRAFQKSKLAANDRLLLAGPMNDFVRQLVAREAGDLVRAGRILTVDRPLSVDEVMLAVSASDLVAVSNPNQMGSSSFVIRAAAAGRPVLTSDFGWMGWAVPRFELGWTVNVLDPEAFARSLETSLNCTEQKRFGEVADRFVRYHSAENFQAHWFDRLRERLGMPRDERFVSWDWVAEGNSTPSPQPIAS